MKAAVCSRYGPPEVLQVREVAKPAAKENEVLIKIHAASVTISDCIVRSGKVNPLLWLPMRAFVGFRRPRNSILGLDLAGEVVEVGSKVTRYKKGEGVMAFSGKHFGAYAEYVCLPEDGESMPNDSLICLKPSNLNYSEASAVPSRGTLAYHFLKGADIRRGQKVLIYGASGGIGTFAIQIAKHLGAHVTAVCGTANLELVRSLSADRVIDYTKDSLGSDDRYDLVFDAVGKKSRSALRSQAEKALTPEGRYISIDRMVKIPHADLEGIKQLIETGAVRPVIDRTYSLDQIVEAHHYVEGRHKRGNLVILIGAG